MYFYTLMETEPTICDVLRSHLEVATNRLEIGFLVALYITALRVALQEWLAHEAQGDLVSLVRD
jgi:hypothetical protein